MKKMIPAFEKMMLICITNLDNISDRGEALGRIFGRSISDMKMIKQSYGTG